MIQIIDSEPSGISRFLQRAEPGINSTADALGNFMQRRREAAEKEKQHQMLRHQAAALGLPEEILDPSIQKMLLEQRGSPEQLEFDQRTYDTIANRFGEQEADLYRSATEGGKTALLNRLLENEQRFKDINEQLDTQKPNEEYRLNIKGMTPKEVVGFKSDLRKSNEPIWKENRDKLNASKEQKRDIKVLRSLNEKGNLPEGFSKLLINPETNAPYELVTAVKNMHPDVQRWVKTIARQATLAQSAFPGRVTNFDLQSYMRQFPSLFNTPEGRKVILDQMELINEGNELFENSLNKVYNKYKLSGITPEDAQDLAQREVSDKLEEINKKIVDLSEEGELFASESNNSMDNIVQMLDPSGNPLEVPRSDVEKLKTLGATLAQ